MKTYLNLLNITQFISLLAWCKLLYHCQKNCIWANIAVQSRNRSSSIWIEYNGVKQVREDWATELKVSSNAIGYHLKIGKSFSEIYTHFTQKNKQKTIL